MLEQCVYDTISEMDDSEYTNWKVDRAGMLAYRHARGFLSDMGMSLDDPNYMSWLNQLYNERLNELWNRYKLPEALWPDGKLGTK